MAVDGLQCPVSLCGTLPEVEFPQSLKRDRLNHRGFVAVAHVRLRN
jgi:hypothetical protein